MKDVIAELHRIVQQVTLVREPSRQVRLIVDQIAHVLKSEVCSLYRVTEQGSMALVATHGLDADRPVTIPMHAGLVGLVARTRHVVNLANGLKHPEYFHVADLLEERFKSFCGVPLVHHGEVIGVLVVQGRRARKLSARHEAFLSTLAAHIALLLPRIAHADAPDADAQQQWQGIAAAPGLGIGHVLLCRHDSLANVILAQQDSVGHTLAEWEALLLKVDAELKNERAAMGELVSAEVSNMFAAYQMLLFDPALGEHVRHHIREGYALTSALKLTVQHFAELFLAMDDPYMKARHEDVWHLGNKLYHSYHHVESDTALHATVDAVVLVGDDISVSEIAAVPRKKLRGVVCGGGSRLSHTAILASALGIPAVMGVGDISALHQGKIMIVDGAEGLVYCDPAEALLAEYRNLLARERDVSAGLERLRDLPAISRDGQRVFLYTNSGLVADMSPGLQHGAEGIGLFRTEIPFMTSETFPTEEAQIKLYRKAMELYRGKPVTMRTLDIGGDKPLPYFSVGHEENPALGWRGIRFALDHAQLMITQLRAMLLAAQTPDQLRILLPMVASLDEILDMRSLLQDAMQQLREEGNTIYEPQLGVMVEVPAAISQLAAWRPHIDFVSVGSNDLSQYLLALDRNNPRVANRYDHIHPAVLAELKRVCDSCHALGLPFSVCGEMASDPVAVLCLLGLGVRHLSMSSARLPHIKLLIRNMKMTLAKTFAEDALGLKSGADIRALGERLLREHALQTLPDTLEVAPAS